MREMMKYFTALLIAIISSVSQASQDSAESLALRKSYPIQLYMGACVVTRAQPAKVESQAKEMRFTEAKRELANQYLQGHKGKAWVSKNEHGNFAIAAQDRGLCSVFIHQGSPEKLMASMEAWLPPEGSGFSYKKEIFSKSGPLETTSYKIFRGAKLMEQWVITLSTQPNSKLVAIMSYDASQA
ncbi:NMCC_0638 family (lipo)protein [Microbulbifer sp. CnH-101-G]|uniref:NMCC_0638 family (lipo)protein n=1 Tax=Microbulbifer sp. CnH-101-G TaxID=3243393 RepID=UPI00403922E2